MYPIKVIKLVKEKEIQINVIREEEKKRREEKNRTSRNNIR